MTTFWTDPRWGSAAWTAMMAAGVYSGDMFTAVFGAFWAGISIQRWLGA